MAQTAISKRSGTRPPAIAKALREQAEQLLAQSYDYMDSPLFHRRNIEKELFNTPDPQLPVISWYQPTREDSIEDIGQVPKLMTTAEERIMFLRFNYSKMRLTQLQKQVKREGLAKELAEQFIEQ